MTGAVHAAGRCHGCGTELAPGLLACPGCRTLIHAARLRELAALAERAEEAGDPATAMARWNEALELLPHESRQHQTIVERLGRLERMPAAPGEARSRGSWLARSWGGIVALVLLIVTKGKFLLAGLLKAPTLFSLLASLGVYWAIWGWKFALGLVATTYVHEMGHVAALVRYGIRASPPMFVPGLGAYVRLKQHLPNPGQEARVGLAGPVWGLGAGLACYAIGRWSGNSSWLAIAQFTGLLNLFNLIPLWQLDGGRAFHALTRVERWIALLVIAVTWYFYQEGMLLLLGLAAGYQAFSRNRAAKPDNGALALYTGLVVVLSWLTSIEVPLPPAPE